MRDGSEQLGEGAGPARTSGPSPPAASATTGRERWAQLRRSLWQPPRRHGEQPRERVVGPLELFYDLAVVVLVAQAAQRLAGHLTWPGIGEFAVIFTLVWIAWANGSLHHELHGRDDARARSTFLLQILVLAAMGAFIPQAGGARGAAFAVAAAVLFAVLAVLWLLAARGDRPEYRRPSEHPGPQQVGGSEHHRHGCDLAERHRPRRGRSRGERDGLCGDGLLVGETEPCGALGRVAESEMNVGVRPERAGARGVEPVPDPQR